ncbi:MAG TPA: hypothetical protein VMK32_08735 [Burkholderiaceae bacterium]|nr:hypothetical protein [Burkholderiaceae bacterium]
MPALQVLRDGAAIAAELAALLFLTPMPAVAGESNAADASRPVTASRLPALHVTDAAFDVQLLGLLADLRIVQSVRNDGPTRVDLGAHLPAVAESVDALAITRDGRTTDLLAGTACGGDEDPDAGHALADDDEARADLMQLLPGQFVTVAVSATETLQPWGDAYRLALPATIAAPAAQLRLVARSGGRALLVIPPAGADGVATLTLRPDAAPARVIRLGRITPGFAHVVPLLDGDAARTPGTTAIELEIVAPTQVQWMTLSADGPVELAAQAGQ